MLPGHVGTAQAARASGLWERQDAVGPVCVCLLLVVTSLKLLRQIALLTIFQECSIICRPMFQTDAGAGLFDQNIKLTLAGLFQALSCYRAFRTSTVSSPHA